MDVECAKAWNIQECLGQNVAVGCCHAQVRGQRAQRVQEGWLHAGCSDLGLVGTTPSRVRLHMAGCCKLCKVQE